MPHKSFITTVIIILIGITILTPIDFNRKDIVTKDIPNIVNYGGGITQKDNTLFFDTDIIHTYSDTNLEDFHHIGNEYYSDGSSIFTIDATYTEINGIRTYDSGPALKKLPQADYGSFRINDDQWAEDKNSRYSFGEDISIGK